MLAGIVQAALFSETVGMFVSRGFRNGVKPQSIEGLHRPVMKGGYAQRTAVTVLFRDIDPAQRLRLIAGSLTGYLLPP